MTDQQFRFLKTIYKLMTGIHRNPEASYAFWWGAHIAGGFDDRCCKIALAFSNLDFQRRLAA